MVGGIMRFLVTVAAVPLCGYLMDGVAVGEYKNAVVVGLILAVIYTVLRPLVRLVLSVINFCTLGLLNIGVDAWLVWTAARFVKNSVTFENFWWAVAVAVAITAARTLVDAITGGIKH